MPRRYPPEVRRQVIEQARSGTRVAAAVVDARHERGDDLQLAQAGQDRPRRALGPNDRSGARSRRRQAPDPPARDRARSRQEGQRDLPRPGSGPKSLFPVIEALTGQGINIRHACRVPGVSESGYYDWKDRPDPPRTLRRIWLAGEIAYVHKASGPTARCASPPNSCPKPRRWQAARPSVAPTISPIAQI
jgi:hypothetical protein